MWTAAGYNATSCRLSSVFAGLHLGCHADESVAG